MAMQWMRRGWPGFVAVAVPALAQAEETARVGGETARSTGVSALWILANVSYAGMRAQGNRNRFWRILAFIFGFPGTLLSFIVVPKGGERAYGVDLPKKPAPRETSETDQ